MKGIIYRAISPSKKKYYGQTIGTLQNRINKHNNKHKKKDNTIIHNALRKYGVKNFIWEIVEEIELSFRDELIEKLDIKEIYWIEKDKTCIFEHGKDYGYNMTKGGQGVRKFKHSEETKNKIKNSLKGKPKPEASIENYRKANAGKNNPMFGKEGWKKGIPLTNAEKENLRNLYKGKSYEEIHGPEKAIKIKENLSKSLKGKGVGRKHSPETIEKIKRAAKLQFSNPEKKKKHQLRCREWSETR